MIYRQHAYSVVQTSNSAWKWTVQFSGSDSTDGESHRRENAVVAAWSAIDQVFDTAAAAAEASPRIGDGRLIVKPAL
ncbi:MAG: hypothetical protein JWQ94_2919 [Tardiphaga sp.]|nr:hypothetical protein [Tardiphaga sp.]